MSLLIPFDFKMCPVEASVEIIGRKWSLNIIRDLFMGRTRFSEFLEVNPRLSSKVLSTRLKELQECGIIEKRVVETTPLLIEYGLTEKGRALGDILYHLAVYSMNHYTDRVYKENSLHLQRDLNNLKQIFTTTKQQVA